MPPLTTIGRYAVQRVLGRGGMGTVYLAVDPLIEREVAIKVLPLAGADEYSDRLIAEARVSGRLIHPNIVGVFDIGEEQGQPFVVMPYVPGRTVASILTDADRPPIGTKLRWMAQLCDALAYAHERRVIHRDIKPTNLLIDDQQNLRVLDFGIAKVLTTSQIQFTSVGTPAYMAPEQYSSDPVDPRTDVFSAGLVLYELITHRRALTGTTPAQIYGQLMAGPPPRVLAAAPGTDPALAAVCERAMARDPRERFQTAREFGEALEAARQTERPEAMAITAPTVVATPAPATVAVPPPIVVPSVVVAPPPAVVVPPPAVADPVSTIRLDERPVPRAVVLAITAVVIAGLSALALWLWTVPPTTPQSALNPEASAPPAVDAATQAPSEPPVPARDVSPAAPRLSDPMPTEPVPPQASPSMERPASTPTAAAIGRLHVSADLPGTVFTMSIDSTTKALSASESNPLPAGRYNVRAAYADRDPLMGGADQVVNTSRVVDVVAGKTTTANFVLAIPLWRARFERALAKPAGHRAALLEQTYRQLKELGATAPSDQPRFTGAASEQQMVRFVMGTLATDVGLEPHVRYKRIDVVSVDGAAQSKAILGGALPWDELVRGRHQFTAVIEVLYANSSQSATCVGSFDVPGGPLPLDLQAHAIVRRPPKGDGKVAIECHLGPTPPFAPAPMRTPAGVPSTEGLRTDAAEARARPLENERKRTDEGQRAEPRKYTFPVAHLHARLTFRNNPGCYGYLVITPDGASYQGKEGDVSFSKTSVTYIDLAKTGAGDFLRLHAANGNWSFALIDEADVQNRKFTGAYPPARLSNVIIERWGWVQSQDGKQWIPAAR